MQEKHLNILEFPKILERLAKYAAFSASKELALNLKPSPYFSEVQGWQIETREASHLLTVKVNLGVGGARDVRPYVDRTHRGFVLPPPELLEVRQTLIAARELYRNIIRLADAYPRLADIAQRIEECPGVVNAISQAIEDSGEVKSSASANLARIRREMDIAHNRLTERLNRIITSSQLKIYLQDTIVTQRGGRYVVPVKAEFKGRIQGVIQDQSASGATIFVEPLAVVELNNKWRQLQLQEEEEIQRILAELSALISSHGDLINHTVEALAELDLAFAKAKYAWAIEATEPNLIDFNGRQTLPDENRRRSNRPAIELMAARHPLLDPETVVPLDLPLPDEARMVVITGPNTGGKTVSLKTIGLLAAMAQAGLWIPATEGSRLPIFNNVLADIGDEQSIEQSLSTFSGHMTNIVRILTVCDEQSLVIFDELGAGTDPEEGSALARAIMLELLERGTTTFVATHYSELKAYAHATSGVINASMAFDAETLTPTYRLQIGIPGESNAFTIARRLGLPDRVIDQARNLMSEGAQQLEAMLGEIKTQAEAAQAKRLEAETELEQAQALVEERRQQLTAVQAERRDILNSARADARREIKAARERIRVLEAEAQADLERRQAAAQAAAAETVETVNEQLETLESSLAPLKALPKPEPNDKSQPDADQNGPIRVGDQVFINQYQTLGEVVAIAGPDAEVQLGHFRATVPLKTLELKGRKKRSSPPPSVKTPVVESPGMELDLRGHIADEALLRLDHYLDQAFLAQLPWVRIIHGRGSGVLRQTVRQALSRHPMISTYRAGREGEGGDGVTIAKLAVN
ncbi:MAG: endonuclease MutS2 [Anaerolineaceae bacterium]|nr:endonuclease MutS2 [Anaerolineaceae bacterium]MCB9099380.1 endonuclease MutS2 [Anaerolineales bacterium]